MSKSGAVETATLVDTIDGINTDRIDWLCQDRGITRDDLSKKIGIGKSTIAKLFEVKGGLTFNQLKKIADYFDQGVLFLLEPTPIVEEHVRTPAFRTLMNQKPDVSHVVKSIIRRSEAQRELFLSLREQLDSPVARFSPPDFAANQDVRAKALAVRQWLNLGAASKFDDYRSALEAQGILVFRSNGYAGKWQMPKQSRVLGFSLYFETCPLIFVRKLEPEVRQTFTLMHELGHVLLQRASFIDDEDDVDVRHSLDAEGAANRFAGNVLVSDEHLQSVSDAQRPEAATGYFDWLGDLRRKIGVSTDVILYRLVEAQRLPRAKLDEYYATRSTASADADASHGARLYRHREPKHIFGNEFVRTVVDALSSRQITLTRASRYLDGLKLDDLHKLERYCADL